MPHLVLYQPHLHQTPFTIHHCHRRQQPPVTTTSFLQRWSVTVAKPRVSPAQQIRSGTVRCMANPRRVKMVAKQIRRELSDMLLTDKVLQYAVLPEASLGADRYLSSLTTISDVEVSADLQGSLGDYIATWSGFEPENILLLFKLEKHNQQGLKETSFLVVKVYVSVFGDERGREVAMSGLKSKAKYVRSKLGKRMKLRLTPEIRFIEDDSMERGSRVIGILDRIKNEKDIVESQGDDQIEPSNQAQGDRDWEGDDPDDEGIVYVK